MEPTGSIFFACGKARQAPDSLYQAVAPARRRTEGSADRNSLSGVAIKEQ
jgi:hypothetical protein